jgi:ubiquinone/menaquinone biosynthesis C-methylase UbiE
MNMDARAHAQSQWNSMACGELEGDKSSVEYFLAVEKDRFEQQAWAKRYFSYAQSAGQKVLEIGVGQGTDLMQFARAGADCYGVDITDNHLELTARNFQLQGKTVSLHKADATKLPFEDKTFDIVYSFGVLHHIPDIENVMKEIYRVLIPGGCLMLSVYNRMSAFHLVKLLIGSGVLRANLVRLGYDGVLSTIETGADGKTRKPYVKLYTKPEVRKLVTGIGLKVDDISVHQFYAEHFLPSSAVPIRNRELPFANRLGWYVCCRARK